METEQTPTESDKCEVMTAAIDYLQYVKTTFREEPERYGMFLECIRGLQEGKYDLIQTGQRLSEILRGYSQLIARFNSMPLGKEVTVVDYDREQLIRDLDKYCSPAQDLSSSSIPTLNLTGKKRDVFHEQAQNHSPTLDSTSKRIKVNHEPTQNYPSTLVWTSNIKNVHKQVQSYPPTLDLLSNRNNVVHGQKQNYRPTLDWISNRSNGVHEQVRNYVTAQNSTNRSSVHGRMQNCPPTAVSTSKSSNAINEQEEGEVFTLVSEWKMDCS